MHGQCTRRGAPDQEGTTQMTTPDPLARAREAGRQKRELEAEYHALCHVLLTRDNEAQERRAAIEAELEQRWPGRWARVIDTLVRADLTDAECAILAKWQAAHPVVP
jgi:hypothetical protein